MRLDQISRKDVRELISRKLQVDKVSRSTVRNILTPLREMLGHATDEEILKANPATNAGRFMRENVSRTNRMTIDPLTREEFRFDNVKRTHPDRVKGTHPLVNGL